MDVLERWQRTRPHRLRDALIIGRRVEIIGVGISNPRPVARPARQPDRECLQRHEPGMDGGLGQRPSGFRVDVALEPVLKGHRLGNMEFAEILEVGAPLELGDGCRDLIDAGLRHALCLLQT
jgi:hypothetical protein